MPEPVAISTVAESNLRHFYDPTGSRKEYPLDKFVNWAADARPDCQEVYGIGAVTPREALLAEITYNLLTPTSPDTTGHALGIDADRQKVIVQKVRSHCGRIAWAVLSQADEISGSLAERAASMPEAKWQQVPNMLLLSGKIIAAAAYPGNKASNKQERNHDPTVTESILACAWRKSGVTKDSMFELARFMSFAQYAYKNMIDSKGQYLSQPAIISPLVVKAILARLQVLGAAQTADTLHYFVNNQGASGERLPYDQYLKRGLTHGGILFGLTEAAAIRERVSPLPPARTPSFLLRTPSDPKTNSLIYKSAADYLLGQTDNSEYSWVLHCMFALTDQEIAASEAERLKIEPNMIAEAIKLPMPRKPNGIT